MYTCFTYPNCLFYAGGDVILPVDPSLSSPIVTTLPTLTGNQYLSTNDSQVEVIRQPSSVIVTEGLPPITTKLLDKIQWWEFVDYQACCLVTPLPRITLLLSLMRVNTSL